MTPEERRELAKRLAVEHQHTTPSGKVGLCTCRACDDLRRAAAALCEDADIPADPAPERTEYPLQRITESQFNGRISIHDFDEVLVPAHSLRAGDRIEWAPGDWREITDVGDHLIVITLWFDDEPFSLNRWDLVAVRR